MKKISGGALALIIVGVIVLILIFTSVSGYNTMVGAREELSGRMSNIDTQLQRRIDLIPNLVNTVKGYTNHESEVLTNISDARAKLAGASTTADKAEANNELSSALSRLLVVVENYPTLKADTQFTALTDELAGTENRIQVARKDYNDAAKEYNKMIKSFPKVIFANIFGFEPAEYFEASSNAAEAPQVSF